MAKGQRKRRPTEAQLRNAQFRYVGTQGKLNEPLKEIAQRAKKTQKQVLGFLTTDPAVLRQKFRRSKTIQDLYEGAGNVRTLTRTVSTGGRRIQTTLNGVTKSVLIGEQRSTETYQKFSLTGPMLGVERVPRVKVTRETDKKTGEVTDVVRIKGLTPEAARRSRILAHAVLAEAETPEAAMTIAWHQYTHDSGITSSLNDLKAQYDRGEISYLQMAQYVSHWQEIYGDDDYSGPDWMEEFGFEEE